MFFQNEETEITVNKEVKNCSMNSGGFSFKVFIPFRIWRLGVFPWWEGKAGIANIEGLFAGDTFRIVSSSGVGLDFVLLLDSFVNPYFSVSAVTTEYNERDASNNLNIAGGIRLYLADF